MPYRCVTVPKEIHDYLHGAAIVAFDFETAPLEQYRSEEKAALDAHKSVIVGVSLSVAEDSAIYIPLWHRTGRNADAPETVMAALRRELFENPNILKIAHNLAFEAMFLYALGIVVQPPCYDTIAAARMTLKNHTQFRALSDSGLKTLVGHTEIDCVVVDLDVQREKALNIALNKIQGGWDETKLAEIMADLDAAAFDVALTGFDAAEVDELLNRFYSKEAVQDDFDVDKEKERIETAGAVTQRGDIWLLGNHRLMCGDSTSAEDFEKLMDGAHAQVAVTAPPYHEAGDAGGEGHTQQLACGRSGA